MAKNKKLFTYLGILLAVVVVGAAVYFGSPKNQRGAFPGLPKIPSQLPRQTPQGDIQRAVQPLLTHYVSPARVNISTGEYATIHYQVNQRLNGISLSIYNSSYELVRNLFTSQGPVTAGTYIYIWDGRGSNGVVVPAGVYTYRFIIGGQNVGMGNITVVSNPLPSAPSNRDDNIPY